MRAPCLKCAFWGIHNNRGKDMEEERLVMSGFREEEDDQEEQSPPQNPA